MKQSKRQPTTSKPESAWQKTQYSNLVRYVPSGKLYARLRVGGKLVWKSLKTDRLTMAKMRRQTVRCCCIPARSPSSNGRPHASNA